MLRGWFRGCQWLTDGRCHTHPHSGHPGNCVDGAHVMVVVMDSMWTIPKYADLKTTQLKHDERKQWNTLKSQNEPRVRSFTSPIAWFPSKFSTNWISRKSARYPPLLLCKYFKLICRDKKSVEVIFQSGAVKPKNISSWTRNGEKQCRKHDIY